MGGMMMKRGLFLGVAGIALGLMAATGAQAQFGGLGRIVNAVAREVPVPDFLSGPQPVSTSIRDAIYADPTRDSFAPGEGRPLTDLPRDEHGGFVLAPGYYTMVAQTYCLHAGTHGPGGGDGYLYAPVKGSAEDAIVSILQNSVDRPDIAQRDIQLLLWAIIARARFENLDNRLKLVAAQLLTQRQLVSLNRNALDVLNSRELSSLIGDLPAPLRAIAQAESQLRSMLTSTGSSYDDFEAVALLAGAVPLGEGSVDVPAIRWSQHPDGYWVRYRPNGYTNSLVEIFVEEGSEAVGKVYDPGKAVAVPGNTSRQRIAQSGRVYSS